jgi:hypothetical protein
MIDSEEELSVVCGSRDLDWCNANCGEECGAVNGSELRQGPTEPGPDHECCTFARPLQPGKSKAERGSTTLVAGSAA